MVSSSRFTGVTVAILGERPCRRKEPEDLFLEQAGSSSLGAIVRGVRGSPPYRRAAPARPGGGRSCGAGGAARESSANGRDEFLGVEMTQLVVMAAQPD